MPTYNYECSNCHHQMEVLQKMSDKRLEVCPECKGKLRRLIGSGSGLIFKGTGFYITDYKKKNVSTSVKESKPASPQNKEKK